MFIINILCTRIDAILSLLKRFFIILSGLIDLIWLVVLHDLVIDKLIGKLSEHLQCKFSLPQVLEIAILDELHDIADRFVSILVMKDFSIGIKDFHFLEISLADANNDCAEGHSRE